MPYTASWPAPTSENRNSGCASSGRKGQSLGQSAPEPPTRLSLPWVDYMLTWPAIPRIGPTPGPPEGYGDLPGRTDRSALGTTTPGENGSPWRQAHRANRPAARAYKRNTARGGTTAAVGSKSSRGSSACARPGFRTGAPESPPA